MASVVEAIKASGGSESVGFLNDIVAHLWPNINVAGAKMTKEIAEPMFAEMLPGPLKTLHFVKIDLGANPMKFANVDVHKTDNEGIKLDMDVDWDGECDIELDGKMIPKVGVEHVKLQGRLSILLCPITNVIPLVGAAQVAFINRPYLKLDFTNAANVADLSIIDKTIRKVMLDIIASMAVVPNRFLVKLDATNDYFKTYQYQQGILRLNIEKATSVAPPEGGSFLSRMIKDVPDCYAKVEFGGEEWKTSTKKNEREPEWNESHDFLLSDHDQIISIDVQDDDLAGDDDIGICSTTVKNVFVAGGKEELTLVHKDKPTEAKLTLSTQLHTFVPDLASWDDEANQAEGRLSGLVTILVAGALGIKGERADLKPSVKVSWGEKKTFSTPVKIDAPGQDVSNPAFDSSFRVLVTPELASSKPDFKITLMNGRHEVGNVDVPFADVTAAPDMILAADYDVESGTTVRVSICVRGTSLAT